MAKIKLNKEGKPVGHLILEVEEMFDKKPDARKKTEFKEWKTKINSLIKDCNATGGFKYYSTVK